jgi:exopolysaccharide biosynthesis polyprenyl glycosylphosphotransferase
MTTVSVSDTLIAELGDEIWVAPVAVERIGWSRVYHAALVSSDIAAGLIAAVAVIAVAPPDSALARATLSAALTIGWLAACSLGRTQDVRTMPSLSDNMRAIARVTFVVAGLAAFIMLAAGLTAARPAVAIGLPVAGASSALARVSGQRLLRAARNRGRCLNRVVVVGGEEEVLDLVGRMRRDPGLGLEPVAACLPGSGNRLSLVRHQVPVVGDIWDAATTARRFRANAIIVGAGPGIDGTVVRRLGWQLEGSRSELVVAPTVSEVSGFRLTVRSLGAGPLVHVAGREPNVFATLCKELYERTIATLALIILTPVMLSIALAIRLTSAGPALFRQTRVGRDGREFTLLKFRTMVANAPELLDDLHHLNICNSGPLFKIPRDPRVTRVGSWLRRASLDELPQLINVVRGQMALVGPRPSLPSEVARYTDDIRRRLLVKPGLTGLWQVSGRSDLSWEESVRLDLRYVENWSLGLDVAILCRTWSAVVKGRGAY